MNNGIVYITFRNINDRIKSFGDDYYFRELEISAKSIKHFHPDLPITLFTDKDPKIKEIDEIIFVKIANMRMKHLLLYNSPYDNTLYLDADTKIINPIERDFDLLHKFDIALTHDQIRKDPNKSNKYPDYKRIPYAFPEFGGGVIFFRKCSEVKNFFDVWNKNFKKWVMLTKEIRDQPSLRVSLWESHNLRFYVLPPEFNIRSKTKNNIIKKIIHKHEMWK